ncbi:cytoplasmic polyadenylation element-binding protein 3-like [Amblyraja radiata]|uniref:cytoplasmic polyadenylation element-binding protein 3-like n=1 Tax=Amblyraja radiata TaxID=386614 RepID=UPI001401ED0D|nr:cytoplasmic polyadenylation element-binding protein 3-like [Amblyraja radiata]
MLLAMLQNDTKRQAVCNAYLEPDLEPFQGAEVQSGEGSTQLDCHHTTANLVLQDLGGSGSSHNSLGWSTSQAGEENLLQQRVLPTAMLLPKMVHLGPLFGGGTYPSAHQMGLSQQHRQSPLSQHQHPHQATFTQRNGFSGQQQAFRAYNWGGHQQQGGGGGGGGGGGVWGSINTTCSRGLRRSMGVSNSIPSCSSKRPFSSHVLLPPKLNRSRPGLTPKSWMEDNPVNTDGNSNWLPHQQVQIRPWSLSDSDFVLDGSQPLDPRKTVFVGGVPRPLKAVELAMIMDQLYGGVCYAGIDTDPELKYPKGAGRVAFANQQSYIAAISARFIQLQHRDIDKRVEVKPYVLVDQLCDECQGAHCNGKFAPFFCANITCLQYYCEFCWTSIHSQAGREYHKPLVKEGGERLRQLPFRWS